MYVFGTWFLCVFQVEHGKKRKEDSGTSDIAIESYRSDNGKLVKENNELHQKLIRQKDEFELTLKGKFHFSFVQFWLYLLIFNKI